MRVCVSFFNLFSLLLIIICCCCGVVAVVLCKKKLTITKVTAADGGHHTKRRRRLQRNRPTDRRRKPVFSIFFFHLRAAFRRRGFYVWEIFSLIFCSFWRFFLWCCRSFFFLFSYLWIFTWIGMGFKLIFFFLKHPKDTTILFPKKNKKSTKRA